MKQVNQAWHRRLFMGAMLLLFSFIGGNAMAQQMKVTGTVKDTNGGVLPGVTVIVQGTSMGTITDFDGNYMINIKGQEKPVLRFSYVGFTTQEIPLEGKTKVDVTLKESAIALNEVVAVGYGVMKKSDVTGATVGVKSDDILKANTSSVNEALQGKMAGVSVSTNSGAPGGDIKIRIRGGNSISGSNAPLVVIDGFIGGSLKELNPNDIASLEVLKDASATAIYGSRGSNGVILVTTKTGKAGDMKINYDGYYGQQSIAKKLDVLDAASYAEVVNAKRTAYGKPSPYSQEQIDTFRKDGGHNWQDEIYRTAATQNHNLSFTGGTDKLRFLFSGQYLDQDGIMKNSNYNRMNYRMNLDAKLSDKLKLKVNISGFQSKEKKFNLKWPNGAPPTDALVFEPTLPIYDENGEYTESSFSTVNNPIADVNELNREATKTNSTLNASLTYQLSKKITLSVSGGYLMNNSNNYGFDNKYTYAGKGVEKGSASNTYSNNWQNTNMIAYADNFGDHSLNITLVNEQSGNKSNSNSFVANDFFLNRGYYDLNYASQATSYRSNFSNNSSMMSFLSRVNYNYKGKYLFTGSIRADGSSKFAKNHKWGYFPSASFAWRISEEGFLSDSEFIDNLKFRVGYGQTGSSATNPYRSRSLMGPGGNYSLDGSEKYVGSTVKYADSPNLSWETTSQTNVGIDLSVKEGMFNITADYYYKKTTDILLYINTAYVSGFGTELKNVGSLQNQGVDLSLGVNLGKRDFKYNGTITATRNIQKVLDLNGATELPFMGASGLVSKVILDRPVGEFYGYNYLGVWKTSQAEEAKKFGAKPGDPHFADTNKDGVINISDKTIIGNATPDWYLGFSNSFSYKNLDMSMMFTATLGQDVFNYLDAKIMGVANTDPVSTKILDRWTPENENSDIPAFSTTSRTKDQALSSRFVEDGSFLRLKNITLGYTLPVKAVKSIGISKLRVYGSVQNVFTITNYSGYDPEVSSSTSDMMPGYDIAPYPTARVWNLGVNISF
ncbi:TonB-dependent receptor [Halosquirtibacter xylanolyticus]|uniref:SusC/RagA family TonB-linked outer membrane protein n=1 Tax=Halosquirtibacter xylanolyticus TaxID=3374599 RepID=UPI003749A02E|nr:TonB-dependent receptor [Prolixibacteraceae bacterium]